MIVSLWLITCGYYKPVKTNLIILGLLKKGRWVSNTYIMYVVTYYTENLVTIYSISAVDFWLFTVKYLNVFYTSY